MVSFKPDLANFGMDCLGDDDTVALMKRRVVDLGGCLGESVNVELDGTRVPCKTFEDYAKLYLKRSADKEGLFLYERVNPRWEVCVAAHSRFEQVSMVNNIATMKGGSHVDFITNQISRYLVKKACKTKLSARLMRGRTPSYPWLFVNAVIDNPLFDSKSNKLTTNKDSFGTECLLRKEFMKKIATPGLLSSSFKIKETPSIPKLTDATLAGSMYSRSCTLIITEGDSAKATVGEGLKVVGYDNYGVFPVKGKVLNVRGPNSTRELRNKEIRSIKTILGLEDKKVYDDSNLGELRYGHLMIMTDQDVDGSHIKGLLINFIHTFWPSLLKVSNFMLEFVTPILKATNKKTNEVLPFYSVPEYKKWSKDLANDASEYAIKYYKGLGTNLKEDVRIYFENMDYHVKEFVWIDQQDDEAILRAFSKEKIGARKIWLQRDEARTYICPREKKIRYRDFFNIEYKQYCIASIKRAIPSMVDGMKPSQRKIIFCSLKKSIFDEMKVSSFLGHVIGDTAYQHGEASLYGTVLHMARDFVGSNNISLLEPAGQYGTREMAGKDAAHSRYINTQLSPITLYLFHTADEEFLEYLNDEGHSIEPAWFLPIIPLGLVNGSGGIAVAWSNFIPNFNPQDIIDNLKRLLNDQVMDDMHPWYKGFKGTIRPRASGGYTTTGVMVQKDENVIISELPLMKSVEDYTSFLERAKKQKKILGYSSLPDGTIHITLSQKLLNEPAEKLIDKLNLKTVLTTTNMHMINAKGELQKFDNPKQILKKFYRFRLSFYEKRKASLILKLRNDLLRIDNKVKFIRAVCNQDIACYGKSVAELCKELREKGFKGIPGRKSKYGEFDYLLSIPCEEQTPVELEKLKREVTAKDKQIDELGKLSPKSLWLRDLDALDFVLKLQEERDEKKRRCDFLTEKIYSSWVCPVARIKMQQELDEMKKEFDALDNQLKEQYKKAEAERDIG